MEPTGSMAEATRSYRRVRRRRIRVLAALAVTVLLAPAVYSYTTTMVQPSSLPLWPRSVEWLRAHHGNWIVDEVEHYYYSWKAPDQGGPQLKHLPTVGLGAATPAQADGAPPHAGAAEDHARVREPAARRRGMEGHRAGGAAAAHPCS